MSKNAHIEIVRNGLRVFNRNAGVLKSDPYDLGLPLSHCSALIDIEKHRSLNPNKLATLLHLDKSSVSRMLINLKKKGLIDISPNPNDGRGKSLSLTNKGLKYVEKINDASNQYVINLFQEVTAQQRQVLVNAFQILSDALNNN
jgi:DNA-binding MarR family transcriptional regulator